MPSPETRMLLLSARQCLDDAHVRQLAALSGEVAWAKLHELAQFHRVAPIVLVNLLQCAEAAGAIPADVLGRLKLDRMRNVAAAATVQIRLERLLAITDAHGWRVMLIKGAALNRTVYLQPWYVVSEDVDLILDQRFDQVPGATFRKMQQELRGHPGVELNFQSHHDLDMNGVLRMDMDRLWQRSHRVPVGRHGVHVLSPEDALLAACVNLCRKRFSRIKELMAVAELIATSDDLDWQAIATSAKSSGGVGALYAGLRLAHRLLDADVPAAAVEHLAIATWRRRFMDRCIERLIAMDYLARSDQPPLALRRSTLLLRYAGYSAGQLGREFTALGRIRMRVKHR